MRDNAVIELVLLIDRSLSLNGREKKIYDLYKEIVTGFREKGARCFITVGLFSDDVDIYCAHSDIAFTKDIPRRDFYVFGNTGLYDATEQILSCADETMQLLREDLSVQKYLYVITDGPDNSSAYCGKEEFAGALSRRRESGWMIRFLDPEGRRIPAREITERLT